jgi:hypothetical protein
VQLARRPFSVWRIKCSVNCRNVSVSECVLLAHTYVRHRCERVRRRYGTMFPRFNTMCQSAWRLHVQVFDRLCAAAW